MNLIDEYLNDKNFVLDVFNFLLSNNYFSKKILVERTIMIKDYKTNIKFGINKKINRLIIKSIGNELINYLIVNNFIIVYNSYYKVIDKNRHLIKSILSDIENNKLDIPIINIPAFGAKIVKNELETYIDNSLFITKLLTKVYEQNELSSVSLAAIMKIEKKIAKALVNEFLLKNEFITRYYSTYRVIDYNRIIIKSVLDGLKEAENKGE